MIKPEGCSLGIGGQYKITAEHSKRLVYIYIRQSTLKQVERNKESQIYQYQLVQRAEALGWSRDRIRVIDLDLGLSGKGSEYRQGFQKLVTAISLGHVGILFGYEVSRLARNNRDWYHLLDLAAVFGTLIADCDGIYDPRLYNDRLLLGLKGTMSEAELHLLHQRLDEGRLSQVRRGEYRQNLPSGFVRLPDGSVVKDPDDQVRHMIRYVLIKFEELGSCSKVLRFLRDEESLIPRRHVAGPLRGELIWKPPSAAAIRDILRNPTYAGAFAYGRRQVDPTKRQPGKPTTGLVTKTMDEWIHLQQDVYPAYIPWEQYLANQERLRQNAMRFDQRTQGAQGAAREGTALLQGLATCSVCGRRINTTYKHKNAPRYICNAIARQFAGPVCMSVSAPPVHAVVVQAFFDAIRPAQLDVLEAILATQRADHQHLTQQWEQQLKRARYEAHLAGRQYNAVDPENRLVAAELERRWEQKLVQLQETQESFERFQLVPPTPELTPEMRQQFQNISETLPQLWPDLSTVQQKELLRSLISNVILSKAAADRVEAKIVWISGHYSVVYAQQRIHREQDVSGYGEMVQRIEELWRQGLKDEQIARRLTNEGFHSARSSGVAPSAVLRIRRKHSWFHIASPPHTLEVNGYLTTRGLCTCLGASRDWIYRRIYDGTIPPGHVARHQQHKLYLIKDDPELIEQLRQRLAKTYRA
jgi:DNA invertase Pin-like site-specific DNA recombinase